MALRLTGQTSGYVELEAPAVAGSNTLTLPDSSGAANQVLKNSATPGTLEYGLTLPAGNGTAHQVLKNSATAGTLEYGLALPTGNGTSGQYLESDGAGGSSWVTPAAGGKILQVVQTQFTDVFSITSGQDSWVTVTGFSAAITPSASTNNILVMCQVGRAGTSSAGIRSTNFRITKDGSAYAVPPAAGSRQLASFTCHGESVYNSGGGVVYMDTAGGTSEITYQVQMMNQALGETTRINTSGNDGNSTDAPYARTVSSITLMEVAA